VETYNVEKQILLKEELLIGGFCDFGIAWKTSRHCIRIIL